MKHSCLLLGWLLFLPASGFAQSSAPPPYDRFHEFIGNSVKSPAFWIEAVGAGVLDQMNHFPKEWDDQDQGMAKRNIARVGQSFVAAVIESSAASALHQHVGYERCACKGGFRQIGHTFGRTFVQRHVDGHLILNLPFFAARYGSAAAANEWYPATYRVGDVLTQGSFALGTAIGLNLLGEFSPELLHLIRLH